MNAASENVRLLYDWTGRQDHHRRLGLWIVVALTFHTAGYLVFRASSPEPVGIEPSSATLFFLPPGSEAAIRLAPILAGADPALFATDRLATRPFPDPTVPDYHPSFENATPPLAALPEPIVALLPPLPRDDGPVVVNDGRASPRPLPPPARATQVTFSGDLAGRLITDAPAAAFTARPGERLPSSTYLVAVDPEGAVRHALEMERTDSPQINTVAIPYLLAFRFAPAPSDSALAWGQATIHWGLDVRRVRLER